MPAGGTFNWSATGIGVAAFTAMPIFKEDTLLVILGAALTGDGGILIGAILDLNFFHRWGRLRGSIDRAAFLK
jgi:hypothetical protein